MKKNSKRGGKHFSRTCRDVPGVCSAPLIAVLFGLMVKAGRLSAITARSEFVCDYTYRVFEKCS